MHYQLNSNSRHSVWNPGQEPIGPSQPGAMPVNSAERSGILQRTNKMPAVLEGPTIKP